MGAALRWARPRARWSPSGKGLPGFLRGVKWVLPEQGRGQQGLTWWELFLLFEARTGLRVGVLGAPSSHRATVGSLAKMSTERVRTLAPAIGGPVLRAALQPGPSTPARLAPLGIRTMNACAAGMPELEEEEAGAVVRTILS